MDSKVLISVTALIILSHRSAGELIQVPRDTTAKVNQSAYFNCSTNLTAKNLFWYHIKNKLYNVYTGSIYKEYEGRVTVDINKATGACNLVIHSVQPEDAGEYKCSDDEGTGEEGSAQLIVLDDDPICQSNIKLDEVVGQNKCNIKEDEVLLSCKVTYHGNIPPQIKWKKEGEDINISEGISNTVFNNTYISTLTLQNDISLDKSAYVCQTSGTTENKYKCVSEVIRLSYSVDNDEVVPIFRGGNLTCVANSTFNCKYRWFHENNSICPVSCNQNLTAYVLGYYHCEAKCFVRGKDCTFIAMKAFAVRDPEYVTGRTVGFPLIVIFVFVPLLVVAIGVAIYLYLNQRKEPRNIEEALQIVKFSVDALLKIAAAAKRDNSKETQQGHAISHDGGEDLMEALMQVVSKFIRTTSEPNIADEKSCAETREMPPISQLYCSEVTMEEEAEGTVDIPNEPSKTASRDKDDVMEVE